MPNILADTPCTCDHLYASHTSAGCGFSFCPCKQFSTSSKVKKICRICKEAKPLTDYYAHPTTKDRRQQNCKACHNADTQQRNKRNPARHLTYKQRSMRRRLESLKESPISYSCKTTRHRPCSGKYGPAGKNVCMCPCHKEAKV